jgi:asparagine synthase (glutamine-hydrolysing)
MQSRGPDDSGSFIAPGVGLAHRRLSIIDLSAAGRCPIANEDGSVQAVHNGEIYNFQALRDELLERGHRFQSRCDSEVIVHGYEEWGTDLPSRLDGMFAFALWDAPRRRLLIARDRIGEKPLFLMRRPGSLYFASSLTAIHAALAGDVEVDPRAIECFLSHSFIPHPHTIWKGAESLPPAHVAVLENGGELRIERYWDLPAPSGRRLSVPEAEERVEEQLERSVRARLIADVPVGGFLSGGVDSSLVMALAARHSPRIDTFSVGFAEQDYSELPYARQVADHIGSAHHELVFEDDAILDVIPELVWQYGQPFGDSSSIPTHLVSRLARQHVKVSLSGDGGDESFAGYWRAESGRYASIYRQSLPEPLRRAGMPAIARVLRRAGGGRLAQRIDAINDLSLARPGAGYTNSESWFNHRETLLADSLRGELDGHEPSACRTGHASSAGGLSDLQQILYDDFQVLLADDYLVKVDVASMAASLEVRPPMLDHHFVEAAWDLPDDVKLRRGERKWLLKRIAAKHVPRGVVYRPKRGFAMPIKHWWRGALADLLANLMRESRCVARGWIRAEPVLRALDDHRAGRASHETRLWLVLWLELWTRIVLEGTLDRSASLAPLARA